MNKLCLNSRDELLMLDLDALAYLQANGNYTQVMYIASKGPLVSLGLSRLEAYIRAALPAGDSLPLVRLGRSLLVNQSFLVQISVTSQKLVLSDNAGHTHVLSAPKPLLKQYKDILSGRAAGRKYNQTMRQEFTIGRDYKGTIMIDDTHRAVSREHAKIIIEDNDTWILQDAGSSNGTFVQQPDGTLRRVTTAQIRPTTKIQLGPPDVNGFCFPASLVLGPNVGYEYAWRELREKLEVIKADKKSFIRKAKIWGWAQKGSAAVGCVVGICLQGAFDDSMSPNTILNLNRALMVAPGLLIAGAAAMFMPDGESIKERRAKLRCPNPNCRRVLSDDEIAYGMCQLCKCRPQ